MNFIHQVFTLKTQTKVAELLSLFGDSIKNLLK